MLSAHRDSRTPYSCARKHSLAAVVVAALVAVAGCSHDGGDPRALVPVDASAAVVVPTLETLRADMVGLLAGIEGTSGVLELLNGRYGLDMRSAESLEAAGIDGRQALTMHVEGDVAVVAVGVVDDERFKKKLSDQVLKASGGTLADAVAGGQSAVGPKDAWAVTWGVKPGHIGVVCVGPTPQRTAEVFGAVSSSRGGFVDGPAYAAAKTVAGPDASAYVVTQLNPQLPDQLGMVKNLVEGWASELPTWSGGATVASDRLSVVLESPVGEDAGLPLGWVTVDGPADVLAKVFPKTTTLFMRGRTDIGRLRKLPSFLRKRLIPKTLPGMRGLPVPPPAELIEFLDGDWALALLGIDQDATLQNLAGAQRSTARALRFLHVAFAARITDPELVAAAFAKITKRFAKQKWTVAEIEGGGWVGVSLVRDGQVFSVLWRDGIAVWLSGAGEVQRFIAVGEGRALPLASVAEGEPVAAKAVGVTPTTFGLNLSSLRVTRELAEKGVPPYFLKIINDLRIVSASLDATPTAVRLNLDIAL